MNYINIDIGKEVLLKNEILAKGLMKNRLRSQI